MAHLAAKANVSLRDEIGAVIAPWNESSEKPPYSPAELTVMAVMHSGGPLSVQAIQGWITKYFRYCRRINSNDPVSHLDVDESSIYRTGRTLDVPLDVQPVASGFWWPEKVSITSPSEGRLYLRNVLQPQENANAERCFPFLRLPPELRMKIYELVFALPQSGCWVHLYDSGERRIVSFHARSRSYDVLPHLSTVKTGTDHLTYRFEMSGPAIVLALLRTNQQIYNEAVHVFYSINLFHLRDHGYLANFLGWLPLRRRKHIRHISFRWTEYANATAPEAFRLLKTVEHLQHLDIVSCHMTSATISRGTRKGTLKYPDALKIPGVSTLRSIRGLTSVNFHGESATLAAIVVPEMTKRSKPKVNRTVDYAGRKHAMGGDEQKTIGGRAKKVKR